MNQERLESSLPRCVTHAVWMQQNGRFNGILFVLIAFICFKHAKREHDLAFAFLHETRLLAFFCECEAAK